VAITDEYMGVSQLLGVHAQGLGTPKVYAYDFDTQHRLGDKKSQHVQTGTN